MFHLLSLIYIIYCQNIRHWLLKNSFLMLVFYPSTNKERKHYHRLSFSFSLYVAGSERIHLCHWPKWIRADASEPAASSEPLILCLLHQKSQHNATYLCFLFLCHENNATTAYFCISYYFGDAIWPRHVRDRFGEIQRTHDCLFVPVLF